MNKQAIFKTFQTRLRQAFDETGLSISDFARQSNIDRSTLSQLLSPHAAFRLPRADTVAGLAQHLNVSADWLLGLSEAPEKGADLINSALSVQGDAPNENRWIDWHREAGDAKIRYVTVTSIPHHLKTPETIGYEFAPIMGERDALAYAEGDEFKEEIARRGHDYEVCASLQNLENFAAGQWIWNTYSAKARRAQCMYMADQLDALYPDYQLYIFDETKILGIPLILFGTSRAVLNCNGAYLSYTRPDHIAFFVNQFKDMIRSTVVHPHEAATYIRKLAKTIKS